MSISSAFSNAASGLAASARAVQVVSANIANALTPGYAARTLDLSASTLAGSGGGVRMNGISRSVDAGLLGLNRDSGAAASGASTRSAFWLAIEGAVGLPGQGLSAALSAFDSALIAASDRPDLTSRLATLADSATDLTAAFSATQTALQARRAEADAAIARDVETLNGGLQRVEALNDQIVRLRIGGQSTLGLEDERQALISTLAEIVPLREHARTDGRVTLFTTGGEMLLDVEAAEIGFTPTPAMDAGMTLGSPLSALTLRGRSLDPATGTAMAGGRLAANFRIRDIDAPQVQGQLDSLAANLIGRFADPATDATLASGTPGLFTDAGALATSVPGLAARLAVNTAVLPEAGGALWRLRDGIGAVAPGESGEAAGLRALSGALDRRLPTTPGGPALSLAQSLAEVMTRTSTARHQAAATSTSALARHNELTEQSLAQGVDTDAEMQRLLQIEQAYAANARVIETADAMLRRLLEI